MVFTKITRPSVSDVDNVFSFHVQNFCELCAAYEIDNTFPYLKPSTSDSGKFKYQQDFSLADSPMFTECNSISPLFLEHSVSSMNSHCSLKRKLQDDTYSYTNVMKRLCQPQYTMLCYWQL